MYIANYINGQFAKPVSGEYIDNINPSTGEAYSQIPDSDERDVEQAVEAAKAAFPAWSQTSPEERFAILMRLVALIERDLESLALAESDRSTASLSRSPARSTFRGRLRISDFTRRPRCTPRTNRTTALGKMRSITRLRQPLGVVGCISPWNLPLYLFTWKIAPAIAAGCTVVAKPSEVTPMTAYLLSKLCIEAGLPAGVLNIVHGLGPKVGSAIVAHKDVKAISFTGGTKTGEEIARVGGTDVQKTLARTRRQKSEHHLCRLQLRRNAGDDRSFVVLESRRDLPVRFADICRAADIREIQKRLCRAVSALKVGDPLEADTDVGAIVSKQHFDKIMSYIDLAKKEGGTISDGRQTASDTTGGWPMRKRLVHRADGHRRPAVTIAARIRKRSSARS